MSDPGPVVFVVDDDLSIRDALTSLLRSVGLRVETFGSAREFLTRQPPDAPGCLVLDVRLPGLSGLDLQRELAAAQITMPIIFITGHGDIPMTVQAMKAGAVEFLTKPFRDQELLDAIAQAIARDRVERQQRADLAALRQRYACADPAGAGGDAARRLRHAQQADRRRLGHQRNHHQAAPRSGHAQDAGRVLSGSRPDGRHTGPPRHQVLVHLYQRIIDSPPHRLYISLRIDILLKNTQDVFQGLPSW